MIGSVAQSSEERSYCLQSTEGCGGLEHGQVERQGRGKLHVRSGYFSVVRGQILNTQMNLFNLQTQLFSWYVQGYHYWLLHIKIILLRLLSSLYCKMAGCPYALSTIPGSWLPASS